MINQSHPPIEHLIDYVHGELSPEEDAAIHAHLAGCTICSEAHDDEVRLGEVLRAQAHAEEREFPPGLRERILALAQEQPQTPSWWKRLSVTLRPAITLPAAAAAGLLIYFGAHMSHGTVARRATVDAAYYLEDHAALAATLPFEDSPAIPVSLTADDPTADEQGR